MIPAPHLFALISLLIARNIPQIHLFRRAKILTGIPVVASSAIKRASSVDFEDTALARLARSGARVKPACHASIDEAVSIVQALVDFRIVGPDAAFPWWDQAR